MSSYAFCTFFVFYYSFLVDVLFIVLITPFFSFFIS